MTIEAINAPDGPSTGGAYAQAVRLTRFDEFVFVSGQIPVDVQGDVPVEFGDQCRLVWRNIEAQLRASGLSKRDIVKVTTFLSDRAFAEENSTIRRQQLEGIEPALTIIITGIYDPRWLLEIEVVAARHEA